MKNRFTQIIAATFLVSLAQQACAAQLSIEPADEIDSIADAAYTKAYNAVVTLEAFNEARKQDITKPWDLVKKGDDAAIRAFVQAGGDINKPRGSVGNTILMDAVRHASRDLINFIVLNTKHEINPLVRNKRNETASAIERQVGLAIFDEAADVESVKLRIAKERKTKE